MSICGGCERVIAGLLLVVHLGLLAWALVGFAEWALPTVPWQRISNPLFSSGMLLLQWSLIALAAATYLVGFSLRWSYTPLAMTALYAAMALVCAYQTFFILTDPTRFRAMALEYVEYVLVLAFLFLSPYMRGHFTPQT